MSKLKSRLNSFIPEREIEVEQVTKKVESVETPVDNPHTLYKDIIENPVPKGTLPETLSTGHTLDFSALEKYQIFVQSPKNMRTYMRYQKANLIEEIKGFGKKKRVKFPWGLLLIAGAAIGLIFLGYLILSHPDAITNFFSQFTGGTT